MRCRDIAPHPGGFIGAAVKITAPVEPHGAALRLSNKNTRTASRGRRK